MVNIAESNDKGKPTNHLRGARAKALEAYLLRRGTLSLSASFYQLARFDGWTRPEIETAINDLVEAGHLTIKHTNLWLSVELAVESKDEVKL